MKILFVCLGNTCRSPMAEALYKHKSAKAGRKDIVFSRGTEALEGYQSNAFSIQAMASRGLDISQHRTAALTEQDLAQYDLVLAMKDDIATSIRNRYSSHAGKVHSLGPFVGLPDCEVADPIGSGFDAYEKIAVLLDDLTQRLADKLNKDEVSLLTNG